VASGKGTTALFLVERFGCQVVVSITAVKMSPTPANWPLPEYCRLWPGLSAGDAENLPFPDKSFDTIICECAFCTFPNKTDAAREIRARSPPRRTGRPLATSRAVLRCPRSWIAFLRGSLALPTLSLSIPTFDYLRSAAFELEKVELMTRHLPKWFKQIA